MSKKTKIVLEEPVWVDDKEYAMLIFGDIRAKHLQYIPNSFWNLLDGDDEIREALNKKADIKEVEEIASKIRVNPGENIKLIQEMIPLFAALANVDKEVIEELTIPDLLAIFGKMPSFLAQPQSQKTGEK